MRHDMFMAGFGGQGVLLAGTPLSQAAIVEVLLKKSLAALRQTGLKRLVVAGGVGANLALRQQLNAACTKLGVRVHYPELSLCTDNGAMIAMAAPSETRMRFIRELLHVRAPMRPGDALAGAGWRRVHRRWPHGTGTEVRGQRPEVPSRHHVVHWCTGPPGAA